jgi:predicted ATP-binding protein involved in virulence
MRSEPTVYISYSSGDRERAEHLAIALQQHGISAWWDPKTIPIGTDWHDYFLDVAVKSTCVVVLWSSNSSKSDWVLQEAETAANRKVLLPAVIDSFENIPERFSKIQAADLREWLGDPKASEFQRIVDAVRRFAEIAPSGAEETKAYKASQRSFERRAEDLFQRNLRSASTVEHIELKGTSFYRDLSWNLNSRMNILLGRNGYGKSHLLRGVLALLQYHDSAALQTIEHGTGSIAILRDGEEETVHFADEFFDEETAIGKLPVLAIPDTRFVNRTATQLGAGSDETSGKGDRADLCRYGAAHFLEERPYEGLIQRLFYGLCLDYFEADRRFKGEQFELIRGVVRELTDKTFDFERVAREGRDRFTLFVRTEGNEDRPLPIQKASQGTSSVIAMFGLIYEFLKSLRQQTPEVCKRSGIVIIDEVDAHLHPIWQQKIVSLLRDRFPNVQFIITAHNPIVVAGCLEDEVAVLRKNSGRGFSLVQFPNDFVGWQMEDVYRKVFEIESPDDNFTTYDALRPFKAQFQKKAEELSKRTNLSAEDRRTLEDLEEKILYIEKVEQARSRPSREELERESQQLRDCVQTLESKIGTFLILDTLRAFVKIESLKLRTGRKSPVQLTRM